MAGIFLRQGRSFVAMREQAYEAEAVLQELIAEHPEMLAGDDAEHGNLLLIRREAGVSDHEDGGSRWSLDHLYLDASGVPTLVEVKRSSDTRGRREVVAQMLDYAANAATSWKVDDLAAWLDEGAQRRGSSADDALREAFGVDDPEAYWQAVRTNLAAERLRLIFVSDAISPELRRIIEFLNGQMLDTTVLAIEVKQYVDAAGTQQTVVPRVVGQTQQAKQAKRATRGPLLDHAALLVALEEEGEDTRRAADAVLSWAHEHQRLDIRFTRTAAAIDIGGRPLVKLWPRRGLEVTLQTLGVLDRLRWGPEQLDELIRRLERIEGVQFDDGRRWPKTPLTALADPSKHEQFVAVMEDVIRDLPS